MTCRTRRRVRRASCTRCVSVRRTLNTLGGTRASPPTTSGPPSARPGSPSNVRPLVYLLHSFTCSTTGTYHHKDITLERTLYVLLSNYIYTVLAIVCDMTHYSPLPLPFPHFSLFPSTFLFFSHRISFRTLSQPFSFPTVVSLCLSSPLLTPTFLLHRRFPNVPSVPVPPCDITVESTFCSLCQVSSRVWTFVVGAELAVQSQQRRWDDGTRHPQLQPALTSAGTDKWVLSWRLTEASDSSGDRRVVGSQFQVLEPYAAKPCWPVDVRVQGSRGVK